MRFKQEKGITIVALVVTIIVLMILTLVVVGAIRGGIIDYSKEAEQLAKEDAENKQKDNDKIKNFLDGEIGAKTNNNIEDTDTKGDVNVPLLAKDMTPIYWNGSKELVATTVDEWYNYDNNQWANAKTSDGSYWVWIPRYAYKITEGYHSNMGGESGTIEIIFLKGTSNTPLNGSGETIYSSGYSTTGTNTSNAFFLHPAFQNGSKTGYQNGEWDKELTGIWVAKFEASRIDATNIISGSSTTVSSRPGVKTWIYTSTGSAYTICLNMMPTQNSHLIKNSEWGAVAYLTHSKYGRNRQQVELNYPKTFDPTATIYTGYYFEQTPLRSTTGNLYGIYDMAGGAWERTAAYISDGNGAIATNGSSFAYTSADPNPTTRSTKYSTAYAYLPNENNPNNNNASTNYAANSEKYGDAIYEISSGQGGPGGWFADGIYFPSVTYEFFERGGGIDDSISGTLGIFCHMRTNGAAESVRSFRPVLAF